MDCCQSYFETPQDCMYGADKMRLRDAIEILIHHAKRDLVGVGCGIRTIPNNEEQREARWAIQRAERYLYGSCVASSASLRGPPRDSEKGEA